jgi:hypothetical protein
MKKIILNHLKRWGLVWIAIGIFNCFIFLDKSKDIHYVSFPTLLWISAFALNFDLQRGCGRILITLPVSARQIGRAWWILSVALPTLFLTSINGLVMLAHSAGSANGFPMNDFIMTAMTYALFFGSTFYVLIGSPPGQPQNVIAWVRTIFTLGFFLGMFFIKPGFDTLQGIILLLAAAALTVIGWFQVEQMVLLRANFRLVAKTSRKNLAQYKTPQSFGGLPYLVQRIFIQSTLIGLGLMACLILFTSFFLRNENPAQPLVSLTQGGSTPYVFYILMFSIIPVVFQLRFLRTLPISTSTLAVTFIALPIFSIAAVGLIVTTIASLILGEAMIMPTVNSFLMLGAKAALVVSIVTWRGLEAGAYLLIFLVVLSDSFVSLGMTIMFHLGSHGPARPWWVNSTIFLVCFAASFALTKRLLTQSSSAYRVRTMPASTWSLARR